MEHSKEKWIGILIIAISAVIALLGFFLLPDVMTVQIGLDGKASNTLPKIPALLIPFAISTISSILYISDATGKRSKNLLIAILGVVIGIFAFIVNYGK